VAWGSVADLATSVNKAAVAERLTPEETATLTSQVAKSYGVEVARLISAIDNAERDMAGLRSGGQPGTHVDYGGLAGGPPLGFVPSKSGPVQTRILAMQGQALQPQRLDFVASEEFTAQVQKAQETWDKAPSTGEARRALADLFEKIDLGAQQTLGALVGLPAQRVSDNRRNGASVLVQLAQQRERVPALLQALQKKPVDDLLAAADEKLRGKLANCFDIDDKGNVLIGNRSALYNFLVNQLGREGLIKVGAHLGVNVDATQTTQMIALQICQRVESRPQTLLSAVSEEMAFANGAPALKPGSCIITAPPATPVTSAMRTPAQLELDLATLISDCFSPDTLKVALYFSPAHELLNKLNWNSTFRQIPSEMVFAMREDPSIIPAVAEALTSANQRSDLRAVLTEVQAAGLRPVVRSAPPPPDWKSLSLSAQQRQAMGLLGNMLTERYDVEDLTILARELSPTATAAVLKMSRGDTKLDLVARFLGWVAVNADDRGTLLDAIARDRPRVPELLNLQRSFASW
jgi:hypothetical protein